MVKIFSVEGNIGSGKSTLVNILKDAYDENPNITFMQEPVDDWLEFKDKKGETIISKFYGNQEKYAFSFQMMAYISRISKLKKLVKEVEKNPKSIIICERCVLTDRNVFAKMLYDDKKIEEIDYQIYNKWFDEFIEDIPIDGLIYVKAEPEVSYNRVMKRNREGEVIPLEYLRNCHNYHNTWIEKENTNVLCLDANSDFDYNLDDYKQWINKIDNFVENKEELYETTVSNMMDITYC
jgi:deoxyadenosine/deoxycytidine kinase